MLRTSSRVAATTLFLLAWPLAADEPARLPFSMPVPEGWRTETIKFPLGFAPELRYEGLEELRFAPGMFEDGSEDFWSYAFIWWLPLDTRLTAETLASDLEFYFRGLTEAVAKAREFDPGGPEHKVTLSETQISGGLRRIIGKAATFDAFATREPIELSVDIHIWPCEQQQRLVGFFELSPQPTSHPIWKTLRKIREGFRCEPDAEPGSTSDS